MIRIFNFIKLGKHGYLIFVKLLLAFIIVIIPIIALSVNTNLRAVDNLWVEITKAMLFKSEYNVKRFEEEVKRIYEFQGKLMLDLDLRKASLFTEKQSDFEYMLTALRIRQKLGLLRNASAYIEEARIHVPLHNQTYIAIVEELLVTLEEEKVAKLEQSRNSPLVYLNESLLLSAVSSDRLHDNNKLPALILDVTLSQKHIKDTLFEFHEYRDISAIFVSNDLSNEWIISNETEPDKQKNMVSHAQEFYADGLESKVVFLEEKYETFLAVFQKSEYLNATLLVYVPEKFVIAPLRSYQQWSWIVFPFAIFMVLFFSWWLYLFIKKPMGKLIKAFHQTGDGNFKLIKHKSRDEFGFLFEQYNYMSVRLKNLIDEVYEQKILMQNIELKQLQFQINPHFLYNCFLIISGMAKLKDFDGVRLMSEYLSRYYEYVTRDSSGKATLKQEFDHAENYAQIQSFRYFHRTGYTFCKLPEEWNDFEVPKIILQPLIENCYKHGLKDKLRDGRIQVDFVGGESGICILVQDNGENITDEKLLEIERNFTGDQKSFDSTGLVNIHRRLRIMFGPQSGLFVSRGELGGLCVKMIISERKEMRSV